MDPSAADMSSNHQPSPVGESASIRRYRPGDGPALFDVFFSAVHLVACHDYTAEQIQAWAPRDSDTALWEEKMRKINPFVAELGGRLIGYADVQPNGYIDHFFVSGRHARRGIGALLMKHLIANAVSGGIESLTSDVSRTAQPLFAKFGFFVVEQRSPEIRGVVVPNARMSRRL
jgi:putative acetyltransferase